MLALLALAASALSACTPMPEPTPTPTAAFASEEEAFAAAEETYRTYTDALSHVDIAEYASIEQVFGWLVADAAAASRETFSQLAAEELSVTGDTVLSNFEGIEVDLTSGQVDAMVCIDVSDVDVLNLDGQSIVAEDRPDLQPMHTTFVPAPTPTGLAISSTQQSDTDICTL